MSMAYECHSKKKKKKIKKMSMAYESHSKK